ncbi:MAG: hypothetical protein KZQ90_17985 [Candidatus Thiodiazotropha sp. (ex Codakia rugifera)]|nr:hypothetical protein [Candidatus Thiodiazotropha sp. (ex Codakia rugifera)]
MRYLSISLFSLFLSLMLLQGCGGGGGDSDSPNTSVDTTYTGSTAEATVDASNAKDLSTGAASGTQQAVASDAVSGVAMRPQGSPTTKLSELAPRIAQWIDQLSSPNAARTTDLTAEICDAGGRAVADTNEAETEGSITFTDCAMSDMEGGTVVINGTVTFNANTSGDSLNMVFRVTVTYIGESQAINMTLACSNISTSAIACSITSDFAGIDGRIYRIEDLSVNGNEISGFYVSMTFYDPDHGRVDVITTQPLTYACPTAVPGSGMLNISGSSDTFATASFDSCGSYTVSVNGVGTTYNW